MSKWMDKIKQGAATAAAQAQDLATIGQLKIEIHNLNGQKDDALKAVGAKVYELVKAGTEFPAEVAALCKAAETLEAQIKAKESEIEQVKAGKK